MARAHVDVETLALFVEHAREVKILEVLGVGKIHAARSVSRAPRGSFAACPLSPAPATRGRALDLSVARANYAGGGPAKPVAMGG